MWDGLFQHGRTNVKRARTDRRYKVPSWLRITLVLPQYYPNTTLVLPWYCSSTTLASTNPKSADTGRRYTPGVLVLLE